MLLPELWRSVVYSIRGLSTKFKTLAGCCSLCFQYVSGVLWECKVRLTENPDDNFDDFASVINFITGGSDFLEDMPCVDYKDYTKEFTYRKKRQSAKTKSFDVETELCPICLSDFEEDPLLTELQCSHLYHSACAQHWLRTSWFCPMCRADVRFKTKQSGRFSTGS